ncbi:hypothetical protein [Salsipaludibacter albus]|uniref:hypothetical protein n=1 Tax=Salsipaludibacter albus TaxID=2849650 RepID=UPI001EE42422|nr:hypothetical protein [Salsipaludibacter albus]MBY5163618.1 hypothetical protein [Salsipaludibacter albus]
MTTTRLLRWRTILVVGGLATLAGGLLHPGADASGTLREELSTMTAASTWVPSHTLIVLGTTLLTIGLWVAYRDHAWPAAIQRSLGVTAAAMSAYVVETVFHLASVVDSAALASGAPAPVAWTHVGLALVLYPVSGLAFAWMGTRMVREHGNTFRLFGVVAVVAGLLHAVSVPLTVLLPDAELTPVFATAGMLFATWSIGVGATGLRERGSTPTSLDPRPAGAR